MSTKQWSVIGAGPCGILAVAKLIDAGIPPKRINWIDPSFTVGDLGAKWSEVPSNTIVKLFVDYLKEMNCIDFNALDCELMHLNEKDTCLLGQMVTPLQRCSDLLTSKVNAITDTVTQLDLHDRQWHIETKSGQFQSNNVILANGAIPTELTLPGAQNTLPLDVALSPSKLAKTITPEDTVAVFGSSHSAILILKNLVDLKAKKIINFYLSPCQFALNMGDWTLFDNTGLKGIAAIWAQENINGKHPKNLMRCISNDENIHTYLAQCSHVISATGFKANDSINIIGVSSKHYQPQTGIIAPGLFGLGIAFPESSVNHFGIAETKVGLWKFAAYFKKVLPIWLKYST